MTDFVVDIMTAECQRVLKGETSSGAALPARPEDVADQLAELMTAEFARRDGEQATRMEALAVQLRHEQAVSLAEIQRNARRGRWR